MASERLAPDAILSSSNYSSPNVSDIQDDPDSPDANWLTPDKSGACDLRVSFGAPSADLTTGSGVQNFRYRVKRYDADGGSNIDFDVELWENGGVVSTLGSHTSAANFSGSGELFQDTWDASALSDISGANVEFRINQTGGHSGNPSNRRYIYFAAVEWNAEYQAATQYPKTLTPSATGTPSLTKLIRKSAFTPSATGTASLSSRVIHHYAALVGATGAASLALVSTFRRTFTPSATGSPSLTRLTRHVVGTIMASGAPSLTKTVRHVVGSIMATGTASLSPRIIYHYLASIGATGAAILSRASTFRRTLTPTATGSPSLTRLTRHLVSLIGATGTPGFSPRVIYHYAALVGATGAASLGTAIHYVQSIMIGATGTASLVKRTRHLVGTIMATGAVSRTNRMFHLAAIGATGAVSQARRLVFHQTVAIMATGVASLGTALHVGGGVPFVSNVFRYLLRSLLWRVTPKDLDR